MTELYLGALSGTSMDAIDVAAFDFSSARPLVAKLSYPLPSEYKQRYLDIISQEKISIPELGDLDSWTGELFANAVLEFLANNKHLAKQLKAIGHHGQTLWHAPRASRPFTLQIGDANIVAQKTGLCTVADFRRADIAVGGQGAPLAPLFHKAVFYDPNQNRCIINVGGMSNISVLANDEFYGFDIGPGNCLMDYWTQLKFNLAFDENGDLAKVGSPSMSLLNACLADPYFQAAPPKSTGREYFNPNWLMAKMQDASAMHLLPQDILATLLLLTASSIVQAIKNLNVSDPQIYLCGGGAKNTALCTEISRQLGQSVHNTAELGINSSWVEAGLFAWLAKQRLDCTPLDLSSFTGAKQPVILGAIYASSNS